MHLRIIDRSTHIHIPRPSYSSLAPCLTSAPPLRSLTRGLQAAIRSAHHTQRRIGHVQADNIQFLTMRRRYTKSDVTSISSGHATVSATTSPILCSPKLNEPRHREALIANLHCLTIGSFPPPRNARFAARPSIRTYHATARLAAAPWVPRQHEQRTPQTGFAQTASVERHCPQHRSHLRHPGSNSPLAKEIRKRPPAPRCAASAMCVMYREPFTAKIKPAYSAPTPENIPASAASKTSH